MIEQQRVIIRLDQNKSISVLRQRILLALTARKIAQDPSERSHEVWRRKYNDVGVFHLVECWSLDENKWYYQKIAVSLYFEYKLAEFCR